MLSAKSYLGNNRAIASAEFAQHSEQQASNSDFKFDDSVLAGFRQGYGDRAAAWAEKTLLAGQSATETILHMAGWIQEMKSQLSRKEFGTFVKELLQWVGDEARKYLDIARAFEGFDLSRLIDLEPFTILKLRAKRYAPVVALLQEQPVITSKLVQDLIKELLPKSKKKIVRPISGWKRCPSGGGRYYQVHLHDEQTGLMIEQQAQELGILPQKVIAQAIALLRAQNKSGSVQPEDVAAKEERKRDEEYARSLEAKNRELAEELQKSAQKIADLEVQLARSVATSWDEVAFASCDLNEYLKKQVAVNPEQTTEYERQTIEVIEEPEQEDDYLVEPLEDARNEEWLPTQELEAEPEPQVFYVGASVEIVSIRQGAEFVGQIGIAKVANAVGCVVEVLSKTLWFCVDELVLVSPTMPRPKFEES